MPAVQNPIDVDTRSMKVTCPKCGGQMRLARVQPHETRDADTSIYDCACGNTFMQTVERQI